MLLGTLVLSVFQASSNNGLASQAGAGQQGGLTQYDPVTGLPTLNKWTLDEEVLTGKAIEPEMVAKEEKLGFQVDGDEKAKERIGRILSPLIKVSHLPKLPWRFHVSSNPEWNANARWGGTLFVYKGLLDEVSDVELAAVLGHELAHVTCRHITETLTHQQVAGLLSDRAKSAFYKTSYTTEQEAEADKVGILYMALAGFDPRSVSAIWQRRQQAEGPAPRNYLNDHPLNAERAQATKRWGEAAVKYYRGDREVNPDFGSILVDNELAPRIGSTGNETADFLSAALLEHLKFRQTKAEAERREEAASAAKLAEQQRKAKAVGFLKIEQVKVGKGKDGKPGVFADIRNTSNTAMKWIDIQFSYKTTTGTWELYGRPVRLEALAPGELRSWGTSITDERFMRAAFGVRIVDIAF